NPVLGAGFVAAGVELWLRKPSVGDFERLKQDVTTWRGWWTNRAARVLLVFVLSTLGASAGTFVASARIFGRLFGGAQSLGSTSTRVGARPSGRSPAWRVVTRLAPRGAPAERRHPRTRSGRLALRCSTRT